MLIETYDNVYAVVQHFYSGIYMDNYVCRRKADRQLYTIIRVRNKKITNRIMEFISGQKNNKKFSDFIEYFVTDGDLHVVFAYMQGISLQRKLEQSCSPAERMELGKRILERLILLEQPCYFICECLEPEHIVVTDAGDVGFRYTLAHVEEYDSYTAHQAAAYLYRILQLLFTDELQKHVLDPMETYLKQLQKAEKFDCMVQYRLYSEACEEIRKIPEEEFEVPKNFLYSLWNFFKSMHGFIKRTLLTLIFIGVFIYMIYSIYMSFQIKGYVRHFETIGTVEIEEGTDYEVYK